MQSAATQLASFGFAGNSTPTGAGCRPCAWRCRPCATCSLRLAASCCLSVGGRCTGHSAWFAPQLRLARALYDLTLDDSRIGFESSNQYYYTPLDLVEKVVNCEFIARGW